MANVVFRRVGGRIIPIKMQNESHGNSKGTERAKGAALIAAGGALAYGAGHVASQLTHLAARKENLSYDQAKISKDSLEKGYKQFSGVVSKMSTKTAAAGEKLLKQSFAVKNLGTIGASALVGAGIHKILSTTKLKEHPDLQAGISAGSIAATHFGIKSGYLRGVGNRGMKVIKMAAKSAIKKAR